MKRQFRIIFSLALAVLMLVPLALSVFADAAGPTNEPYEVVVNPGGTVAETGDFIPEGTILTIYWEFKQPDGIFGFTEWNGKDNVWINLADVTNGDVIPEERGEKGEESTFEVFGENAVDVYAGPGYAYNVLFSIPSGGRMSGSYHMADWVYVRYGDQGGWVLPIYGGLVRYYEDPVTVWVVGETDLLKYQNIIIPQEEDILCKIPADTKLESHHRDVRSGYYYVTYEGESGWVNSYGKNVSAEIKDHYKANADMTLYLYDLPFDLTSEEKEPESTLEIKKGEPYVMKYFTAGYDYVEWTYVKTEGGEGWTPSFYKGYYEGDEEKELMNKYPFVSKLLEQSTGITEEEYEAKLSEQSAEQDDVPETDIPDEKEDIAEMQDDKDETETKTGGFFSSPKTVVIFSIASACVLVLAAIVMLLIIKKRREN